MWNFGNLSALLSTEKEEISPATGAATLSSHLNHNDVLQQRLSSQEKINELRTQVAFLQSELRTCKQAEQSARAAASLLASVQNNIITPRGPFAKTSSEAAQYLSVYTKEEVTAEVNAAVAMALERERERIGSLRASQSKASSAETNEERESEQFSILGATPPKATMKGTAITENAAHEPTFQVRSHRALLLIPSYEAIVIVLYRHHLLTHLSHLKTRRTSQKRHRAFLIFNQIRLLSRKKSLRRSIE